MPSADQIQNQIAALKKAEADCRKKLSDARADGAKAAAAARDRRDRARRSSASSIVPSHLREAESLEKKASDLQKKAAEISKRLADNSTKQASKMKELADVGPPVGRSSGPRRS